MFYFKATGHSIGVEDLDGEEVEVQTTETGETADAQWYHKYGVARLSLDGTPWPASLTAEDRARIVARALHAAMVEVETALKAETAMAEVETALAAGFEPEDEPHPNGLASMVWHRM